MSDPLAKPMLQEISPETVKSLSDSQLQQLAEDIRAFLIDSISRTGGHIGANLATIELSLALHKVFDSPADRLVFDTGHQGYTHKIITGRLAKFPTLNRFGGMSRFLARSESEHDAIDASHAGTAISLATGMAFAYARDRQPRTVVAVVGDGSLVEGMSFEALNYAATSGLGLVILINDNEMAIAPSVGGMRNLTAGSSWELRSRGFFEGLGFTYIPVADGHSIHDLVAALDSAKSLGRPVVVHAKTRKGKGLELADSHPYKMHFSLPFDPVTGTGAAPTVVGKTFGLEAAQTLRQILETRDDVFVITPATPYASYLQELATGFPDRVIDVGMAEQQAIGMACGMALRGKYPIVCIQTTFLQRAFDQLIHDVAYMNLPVTLLGVRSGFAGYDSPTHHGVYDIPYLRSIPNLAVVYPYSPEDLQATLAARMKQPEGPMVILHPYEVIPAQDEIAAGRAGDLLTLAQGDDGAILFLSNGLAAARALRDRLRTELQASFGLHCLRGIKPAPLDDLVRITQSAARIVTIEECSINGGIGSLVAEVLADHKIKSDLLRLAVPDIFVPAGDKAECRQAAGLDDATLLRRVAAFWPELAQP